MLISVIITTYKRADYLRKCLEAVATQVIDPSMYEVIVVDNNSQDGTESTVFEFAHLHPEINIRYILELSQGTSFARNCGIQTASGDYLCFTEDDAAPHPDWLVNLVAVLREFDAGCAGGPIELDYQGQEKPLHLQGELQGLLGCFKLPYERPTPVSTWTEYPWGGNMGFRRDVFSDIGLFNIELGPSGERRLTAEETEFIDRACKRGWKIMYVPSARVRHFVPPERLEKSHLYRVGRGLASSHVFLTSKPGIVRTVRWYASDLWYSIRMFIKLLLAIFQGKRLWFDDYMRFWMVALRIPMRFRMQRKHDSQPNG